MKLKIMLSIPIFSVILVGGFVYFVTVFILIEDCFGLNSSAGGVPSQFVPDVEENPLSDQENKTTIGCQRHCDKCSAYKPPRAHHCRVCRRCVLKMDHHCVWINNCVGHRNYKAFILVVFYATTACAYSLITFIYGTLQKDWDLSGRMPLKIFYITSGTMILGLTLTMGSLLGWHIYLMAHNMTTIEYYDGKRAAWLARKSGLSYHHPFDVGAFKNFTLILGPNMLKWLWPTAVSHIKDGLTFPTARDN